MGARIVAQGFELEEFHRSVPDDELLADIARVAQHLGKSKVTFREYNQFGKFSASTISLRFGRWLVALQNAGLEKTINRDISNEELFENLVEVWTKIGRQPKFRDLTPEISSFSSATYANRFGGWRSALQEFVEWSRDTDRSVNSPQQVSLSSRRTPRNPSWRLRARVLMRDGATCRLCGDNPQRGAKLHVDHIRAWATGGETTLENLQILCERCNLGKGDLVGTD
jgi:hypothetical protein